MPLAYLEIDGRRVCVSDSGTQAAAAPAIVLIHGAGHDHHVWDEVATVLSGAGARTVAPDLPGHGASAGPALADVDAQARWLLRVIESLTLPRVCLVGHSMGSLVALAAAARGPEHCVGLVLVGCVAPMPVAPVLLDAARADLPSAHAMINKWSFGPVDILGEDRLVQLQARNLARMARQPAGALAIDLGACDAWRGGLAAAARVCCPALMICGERDRMTPPESATPLLDVLQGTPGGARLAQVPGAGHSLPDETPEAVSNAILAFVAPSP